MKSITFDRKLLAECAKQRPADYLPRLMRARLSETPSAVTVDAEHPEYVALLVEHRQRYDVTKLLGLARLAPPVAMPDWPSRARTLWREFHLVALTAADPATFAGYVRRSFTPRVPCGECKQNWLPILEQMPPEAATDPFAWSWQAHNIVNAHLGKPEISLEEARRLHGPTEGAGGDRRAVDAASIDN
jgi:hypothetical protein